MKDSTLDILILIAGGIAETILMLALEYIDIITERKFLKNLPTGAQVIKFRYSPAQRWFMGIFALIFLLCAAMSASVVKADYWIPMMFLIFGAACAYGLYRFSGRVIIDAQGVTLVRFGIKTSIEYAQLAYVTNHLILQYIVLHGPSKRIRIEHQLQAFETFLGLLSAAVKAAQGIELPYS